MTVWMQPLAQAIRTTLVSKGVDSEENSPTVLSMYSSAEKCFPCWLRFRRKL